jgi:hypothetical protein
MIQASKPMNVPSTREWYSLIGVIVTWLLVRPWLRDGARLLSGAICVDRRGSVSISEVEAGRKAGDGKDREENQRTCERDAHPLAVEEQLRILTPRGSWTNGPGRRVRRCDD